MCQRCVVFLCAHFGRLPFTSTQEGVAKMSREEIGKVVRLRKGQLHTLKPFPASSSLTDEDHLATLGDKMAMVKRAVRQVINRKVNGLYLWGSGGIGKTYTITQELEQAGCDFKQLSGNITARGLFDLLYDNPNSIHLLEDLEHLFEDKKVQGLLRAALWGSKGGVDNRWIKWITNKETLKKRFTGGLLINCNKPLGSLPQLKAIQDRITAIELQVSPEETYAQMRQIARKEKHAELTARECGEVAEVLIEHASNQGKQVSLRMLTLSLEDRADDKRGEGGGVKWQEMVRMRIDAQISAKSEAKTRKEEQADLGFICAEICQKMPYKDQREERKKAWIEKTGLSEPAFYRQQKNANWKAKKR